MANKRSRPGRTLIVFVLALVAAFGGLALNGVWGPALGLDLQGGTRITLTASTTTGEDITPEKLEEAASIIDNRVNATGVAESEVSTQGGDTINVEIPGENARDLVATVRQTAQLRFRLVAAAAPGTEQALQQQQQQQEQQPEPVPSESAGDQGGPGGGSGGGRDGAANRGGGQDTPDEVAPPAGRAVSEGLLRLGETPAGQETSPDDESGQGASGRGPSLVRPPWPVARPGAMIEPAAVPAGADASGRRTPVPDVVEDGVDFALVVYREEGVWRVEEISEDVLHDTDVLAAELRRWPGDSGALGMVSIDEEFFVLGRVAGSSVRWLLSDVTAAVDWPLARSVVEELGIPVPDEEDEEQLPAGDLAIVADLGVPAMDMGAMLDDYDLYPDEILGQVAEKLGFGPAFDSTLGAPAS
jgi:putative tRNA adenosine deaminase-associated protein